MSFWWELEKDDSLGGGKMIYNLMPRGFLVVDYQNIASVAVAQLN